VGELVGCSITRFIDVLLPGVVAVDVSVAYFTRDTEFRMLTNLPVFTAVDRFTRSWWNSSDGAWLKEGKRLSNTVVSTCETISQVELPVVFELLL
jgi:hypothetical protein